MIKEDYIFANEKLYFRKKIVFFKINDMDALCLYFKKNDSFFVSHYLDFFSIEDEQTFIKISEILSKENLSNTDIANLIILFGNYENSLSVEQCSVIINKTFIGIDLNDVYFSI
jgi:hypothetical protein